MPLLPPETGRVGHRGRGAWGVPTTGEKWAQGGLAAVRVRPLTFAVGAGRIEVHGELMRHLRGKRADERVSLPREAQGQDESLSPATEGGSELQTQMPGTSYP